MSSREFDDGEDRVRGSAALQRSHHREVTPPEGSSPTPARTTPGPLARRAGEQVQRTDYTEAGRDVLRALGIEPEAAPAPAPVAPVAPPLAPVPPPGPDAASPEEDTAPPPRPESAAPEPLRLVAPAPEPADPEPPASAPTRTIPGRVSRDPETGPVPVVRPDRRATRSRGRGARAKRTRPALAPVAPVAQTAESIGLSVPAPVAPPPSRRAEPPARGPSTDVVFTPRSGLRAVLGVLLLASAVATVFAAIAAYDHRTTLAVGTCGTLLGVTLALYGIRAGSSPARLRIHGGQLEVVRGAERDVFDLTSRYTRIQIVGEPGRRGWKVRFARFGRDPLVIDASMVDPHAFLAELNRHRPSAERG
ncbi:hypothetical protein [Nocardioides sp.]|uniref:hypothetical protein n=1 Tax=Nocardioides sp. TaxID=35761 RepID=UPI0035136703